jgi:DNA-binding NarL/FixJ family response regulator
MDVNMPVVDGIEATRVIHADLADIRIIGLSMYEDSECVQAMLRAGAVGYQNKGCATVDLIAAIREAEPAQLSNMKTASTS